MMFFFALFGVAFAGCGLSTEIDPNGACVTDSNGYSTLDADSPGVPISLAISTKEATTDAFRLDHPATSGALDDYTDDNGRYVLACKQVAGVKTVKMSVTRPADMTAFGGEWVQLFPKDSWKNVTNEYEPFTFNEYGAKVPVFRATTTGLTNDAPNEGVVHVFMEVSDEGDYEVMYGNPGLTYDDKWIAVSFRSTLLRVGTPWADCDGSTLGAASYDVGSIMPILFGGPNLNSIALAAGNANYLDVIDELASVTVPVKVVLEIFPGTYTDSAEDYGKCYKAGNACPEQHLVCDASYCEMDVWKSLIAQFKAASPGMVTVLGSADSCATQGLYAGLDLDGIYYTTDAVPDCSVDYSSVFYGGKSNTCDGSKTGVDSGLTECKAECDYMFGSGGQCGSDCTGMCNCGCPSNGGWSNANNLPDCYDYCVVAYGDTSAGGMEVETSVLALGTPLFDPPVKDGPHGSEGGSGGADVYVTLADKDLGVWNPFSWYPYVSPSKWAAIVTEASDVSGLVQTLVDRGYGWVYLTSETGFATRSSVMVDLLSELSSTAARRKLQGRRLEASEPFWACDDTLFQCKPICLKKMGVVRTKVSDTLCSAAPIDQCECKCFHEAQWTCEGESVVCKAKFAAGELKTVGDKVCETRGAPKPTSTAELRVASTCEPVTEMRGSSPTDVCLAKWGTPAPTNSPAQAEKGTTGEEITEKVKPEPLVVGSFATTLAVAALALYA